MVDHIFSQSFWGSLDSGTCWAKSPVLYPYWHVDTCIKSTWLLGWKLEQFLVAKICRIKFSRSSCLYIMLGCHLDSTYKSVAGKRRQTTARRDWHGKVREARLQYGGYTPSPSRKWSGSAGHKANYPLRWPSYAVADKDDPFSFEEGRSSEQRFLMKTQDLNSCNTAPFYFQPAKFVEF